jgi:hypothetical protein
VGHEKKEQTLTDLIEDAREATRELRAAIKDYNQIVKEMRALKDELPDLATRLVRDRVDLVLVNTLGDEIRKAGDLFIEQRRLMVKQFEGEITRLGHLYLNGEDGVPLEDLIRKRRQEFEAHISYDTVIDAIDRKMLQQAVDEENQR